jgi:SAM-dependent methyltransferase
MSPDETHVKRVAQAAVKGTGPGDYARWRATTLGRVTEALEQRLILDLMGSVAHRHVLDLGCGDGVLTATLVERGALATGLDIDRAALQAASRRTGHGRYRPPRFVQGRVERLPFADGVFDVAVAVTVLCLVPDPARVSRGSPSPAAGRAIGDRRTGSLEYLGSAPAHQGVAGVSTVALGAILHGSRSLPPSGGRKTGGRCGSRSRVLSACRRPRGRVGTSGAVARFVYDDRRCVHCHCGYQAARAGSPGTAGPRRGVGLYALLPKSYPAALRSSLDAPGDLLGVPAVPGADRAWPCSRSRYWLRPQPPATYDGCSARCGSRYVSATPFNGSTGCQPRHSSRADRGLRGGAPDRRRESRHGGDHVDALHHSRRCPRPSRNAACAQAFRRALVRRARTIA